MSNRDLPVLASSAAPLAHSYGGPAIPQHYAHPGFSLAQLWAMVWAHRKLTLAIAIGGLVLAAVATKLMPKTYQATATIMVDYEVNDPLGGREFPVGLMGSYIATQIQLIQSPAVMLPVIEKLKLTQDGDFTAGFKGDPEMLPEFVRSKIIKKLTVEQGDWGSQMIYISFASDSARRAALVANTVADVYGEQQFLRLTGPAGERAERYAGQIDELKKKVDEAQAQLSAFRQKSGLLDSGDVKVDLELERLSNLEGRLVDAREQRRAAESRLIGDQSVRDAVLGSNSIQGLRADLAAQRLQLAELQTTLGPRHPQVVQLHNQMAATQSAIDAEMAIYAGNAQNQVAAARSLERQLERTVERERANLLKKRELQNEAAKYERELQTAQTLYQQALDGYDQVALASGGGYNNVRSVSRAMPPVRAKKPDPIVNLLMGLMAGLFIGLAGPLAYELFNRRVRCRDDLDRDFGIPVLAEFGRLPALAGVK